ncbi:MAG: gliding motility-associated C-terminal domain-containing protein, partial [Phaeodactylibacter sp.]|nr:gliding motility-associated C-terminal domain-containing protein [Phaeodactylibacter sp.]
AVVGAGGELCVEPDSIGLHMYIAQVNDSLGLDCVLPDTAYVKLVPDNLSVSVEGAMKVCEGDTVCLTATVTPTALMAMATWTDESGTVVGMGLELCVAPGPGTHTYTVTVDNGCATATDMASVMVLADDTQIEITPSDTVTLCAPEEVCFTVTDTTLWDCIEWVDAGGTIVGTGGELCVTPTEIGLYCYEARVPDSLGLNCILPATACVKLVPDNLSVTAEGDKKACEGDIVCLTATVTPSALMAMGTWTDESGVVVGTGLQLCVTPPPGIHKYTITVNNGCATAMDMATVEVVADQEKIEIIPSDTLLCEPGTVCLTATGPVPDCVVWTNIQGDSLGMGPQLCVVPEEGLNYYIAMVPDLDCVLPDTATVKLSTEDISVEVMPSDTIVCEGESVKLTANVTPDNGMAEITWYDGNFNPLGETGMMVTVTPVDMGEYTYIAIADNGCVADTAMATVTVVETMKLVISPDTILCAPAPVKLSVENPGSDYVVWYDENGDSIGSGMMITVMPGLGIHTYSAHIPEADCVEGDTVMVKVLPDVLNLTLTPSATLVCVGDQVTITAEVDPDWTMAQITWFDEMGNPIGMGGTFVDFPAAGINTYTAVADNGCVTSTAEVVVEGEELNLEITADPDTICPDLGEESQLSVTGCNNCTYLWSPGGSTASSITVAPEETTVYSVTVTGQACTEVLTTTVTAEPCDLCPINRLFIPTAFTPNGDGINDVICLRSEDFDRFDAITVMFYNRWGQQVFFREWVGNPNDPNDAPGPDFFCWDGRLNGQLLPPDVYGYHIDVVCPAAGGGQEEIRISGNFTLLW